MRLHDLFVCTVDYIKSMKNDQTFTNEKENSVPLNEYSLKLIINT